MALIFILVVIFIILIIFTIYGKKIEKKYDSFSIENNILKKSSVDGNEYYVHGKHEHMDEAANTFAIIDSKVNDFLEKLYDKYKYDYGTKRRQVSILLMSRYHTSSLRESSPLNSEKDTSFTINKGDIIAICIRSGIDYGIHDIDTIMFVVLHELTHLAIKAYDHPEEFWRVFKFLLDEAELFNIYYSPDYGSQPVEYCGIKINYSPRWDLTLKPI